MDNGHHSENRSYSDDDLKKLTGLLNVDRSDEDAKNELSDRLEMAAFLYFLALEDKEHDPKLPPSRLSPKLAAPANALEKSIKQIRQFPRQIYSDLGTYANGLGDRAGHKSGANRLMEALDEVHWIVACLRGLEKKYKNQIADDGGNRRSEPRCRFDLALRDIILKFNGEPLKGGTDRIHGKEYGPFFPFLEICYEPLGLNIKPSSLAKTYREHTQT